MKLNLFLLALFIVLTVIVTLYLNRPTAPNVTAVPISTVENIKNYPQAPNFSFKTIDGKEFLLSEFEGKTIILNFWASWCAPCVKEFPLLLELASKEKDHLIFLAISVDAEKENIFKFLNSLDNISQKRQELSNVLIAWDLSKDISQDLFQTLRYPETYIIGPDQTLRKKIIGADIDFSSDEFIQDLKQTVY